MKKIYFIAILFSIYTNGFSQASCFSFTSTNYPSTSGGFTPIIDDFNADGKKDFAGTTWGGSNFFVYMGNGAGSFTAGIGSPNMMGVSAYGITCGDFNNDGKKDLVISSTNYFQLFVGLGTGAFTASTVVNFAVSGQRLFATSADFNNDGNIDLAFSNAGNQQVNIYSGNGAGSFSIMGPTYIMQSNTWGVEKGDFNSDGNIDLLFSNNSGNINLMLGSATGTFVNTTVFTGFPSPAQFSVGDINNDGNLDFVVGAGSGSVIRAALGNGSGGFSPPFVLNTPGIVSPYGACLADFNKDGNLDILSNGWNSNNCGVFFGNGTGVFTPGTTNNIILPGVTGQLHSATSDFDGDSKPDVVMAGQNSVNWVVLLNKQISISGPSSACGNPVTLLASTASSYSWSTGAATNPIVVTPTVNTTYTVTGFFNGCATKAIKTVSVGLASISVVSSSSVLCAGQSATLTASGASTYTWNSTSGTAFFVVSPLVTTTYTIAGTVGACTGTTVFTQSVVVCTGIAGLKANSAAAINVYPNPSNGEFIIESTVNLNLNIINELGQIVKSISLNENNNRKVPVSDLSNGIYFVMEQNNKLTIRQKIVVAR